MGWGYADNVLIPHYRQRPSCGQMGVGNQCPSRVNWSFSKAIEVGWVYGHNQINQSRNMLPGTLPSTSPGIHSTVLGGTLDVAAGRLVVALHTLVSVDTVQ